MKIVKIFDLNIVCISLISVGLIFATQSHAKIDPATIVGAWLFDEGKGKVAEDASDGGHNGKLVKNPKWVNGKYNKALEFNGGNYVELEDSAADLPFGGVEPFTISVWVNPQAGGTVIGKFNGGVIGAYILVVQGGGGIVFHREVAPWGLNAANKTVAQGKFSHVAVTYDGKDMKVYVNGEISGEQPRGAQNTDVATPVLIGARFTGGNPSNFYTGIIDDLALFNVALSKADIESLIRQGLPAVLGLAVEPGNKLTTTWGHIRARR